MCKLGCLTRCCIRVPQLVSFLDNEILSEARDMGPSLCLGGLRGAAWWWSRRGMHEQHVCPAWFSLSFFLCLCGDTRGYPAFLAVRLAIQCRVCVMTMTPRCRPPAHACPSLASERYFQVRTRAPSAHGTEKRRGDGRRAGPDSPSV